MGQYGELCAGMTSAVNIFGWYKKNFEVEFCLVWIANELMFTTKLVHYRREQPFYTGKTYVSWCKESSLQMLVLSRLTIVYPNSLLVRRRYLHVPRYQRVEAQY